MNERIVILLILALISLVLSVIVYNKRDKRDINKRDTKKYFSSVKYSDSPIIQLLTIFNTYFQGNLNNINTTINPNINPIVVPSAITPAGIQAFFMTASAGNITVTIQSASPINFSRYYENNGLLFTTDVNCTLNMGYLNFTGIKVMGHNFPDINFQNISMPFNLTVKLLLNTKDYSQTVVSLKLDNTSTIYFPDSVKQSFEKYWSDRYLDYNTDETMMAVILVIRDEFWDQLNSIANLLDQINHHLPAIEDSFNCVLVANNQKPNALLPLAAPSQNTCLNSNNPNTDFINICNQNSSTIDVISQINLNPWDFTKINVNDDASIQNLIYNYSLVTLDENDIFPNTNFPPNQLYITTNDYSTCYAIHPKSNIGYLTAKIHEYAGWKYGNIIALNKGERPVSLLKTDNPDGTVLIYPDISGNWYSGYYRQNVLSVSPDDGSKLDNNITLLLRSEITSLTDGTYETYDFSTKKPSMTFRAYNDPAVNNPINADLTYEYNVSDDTLTLIGSAIRLNEDGTTTTIDNLGTFHR